jgi:hypothetical protein
MNLESLPESKSTGLVGTTGSFREILLTCKTVLAMILMAFRVGREGRRIMWDRWKRQAIRIGIYIVVFEVVTSVGVVVFWAASHKLRPTHIKPKTPAVIDPIEAEAELPAATPFKLLQANCPKATDLLNWAQQWKLRRIATPTDFELDQLEKLIDEGDVSAAVQVWVARMVYNDGDTMTSAVWARSAVRKAEKELTRGDLDDTVALALRQALIPLVGPLNAQQDPPTLEKFWALQMPIPRRDPYDPEPEWRQINHAAWLVYSGRVKNGLVAISAVRADTSKNKNYSQEQLSELTWIEGLAFFKNGEYDKAAPALETVAGNSTSHSPSAQIILAQMRMPKTPLAVLRARGQAIHEIEEWATRWQDGHSDEPYQSNLKKLRDLIGASEIPAIDRLTIGQITEKAGDTATATVWYKAGIDRSRIELAAVQKDGKSTALVQQLVISLLPGLDSARSLFWTGNDADDGIWEQKLLEIELVLPRINVWDHDPEWRRIGHGESLFMQRHYAEALAEADAMTADAAKPDGQFTEDQRTGIHWLRALVLYATHHYNAAVVELRYVTGHPSFHHSKDAWLPLIVTLDRLGDPAGANGMFDVWVRRYHPTAKEAAPLLAQIEGELP